MRSLVVEDEPDIATSILRLLERMNGVVDVVHTLLDAKHAIRSYSYDLAVVDRLLPDGDGLEFVTGINTIESRPAIIMLTAKDSKEDVVGGLDAGADDYLAKPFEPQELSARVRALLRRPRHSISSTLSFGNVAFSLGTNEAIVADNRVFLRRGEALILETLLLRQDRVVSRDSLVEMIYGFDDTIESNSLEAQVSRLRKKLIKVGCNVEIRSMRGIGYILRQQVTV